MVKKAPHKILIMGLGLLGGGQSVVEWFSKYGAQLTVTDLKTAEQLAPTLAKLRKLKNFSKIKFVLGRHELKDFQNQDLIVQNPGVPRNSQFLKEAKKHKIPIVNEAVLFFGLYQDNIIGVTGTRGKSTTATLIHHILKTQIKNNVLAGNISTTPMLSIADRIKAKSWPVLELSSWHLELLDEYAYSPRIGVVTNVMIDHLNRYGSFGAYRQAKLALVKHQNKTDFAVLNFDNRETLRMAKQVKSQVLFFSIKQKVRGAYQQKNNLYFNNGKKSELIAASSILKIKGEHNIANALAAIVVAKIVGISNKNIKKALSTFGGVKYRLEHLGKLQNYDVYNDATATTPDATISALQALTDRPVVLLCGGVDKELNYRALAKQIKKQVSSLVLIPGSGTDKLLKELNKIKFPQNRLYKFDNFKAACAQVLVLRPKQKSYLLFSPAGASFNLFINEFDRARQFEKWYHDQKS